MNDCEQWNLEGDCRKCRRLSYCSKECKKHKDAVYRAVKGLVVDMMINILNGGKLNE